MKTVSITILSVIIAVKGLCFCFDSAHDSVQQKAEQRLAKIDNIAK